MAARKKKQKWNIGDLFTVPLKDHSFSIGRVVGFEPEALNSAICAFYSHRIDTAPDDEIVLPDDELISVLFVTRDLLDSGDWKIFASSSNFFYLERYINLDRLRNDEFIGVESIGSGLVIKLMDAYYKLSFWNDFYEPDFLDSLLISSEKKPKDVILK
ncbi:Imm26 family immunity protein [Pectobacterium parmentieri]|uniref:Uncharacterized protein n=1 Tax=Pectobacterium parmentieri TaxID=1905730 RepID=A0A8B3FJR8_PECPM|nr:Imm26 family immunity protein [Pectobacterium parmentieri]AOR61148.1 hypothetical protein A8F97_19970 [Pectobacterium parmentieri]AYH12187.1 hypothetical protein C5E24_22135 [Pectobacterium parmentieri]AYH20901.1 hypothetical protein C5E22_22015 [Pectobacterium parmentieri]AYH38464.1 hypothetical protein C5E17_21860 [Pectobacterium parmentieri]AZS58691.1 hypothetical protein C5E18_22545 [Pectobacterium parmentieri]